MNTLGTYLKNIRTQRGCSLKDVYDHCGLTDSRLSRAERGEENLNLSELKKLSSFYNVNFLEILMQSGYLLNSDFENHYFVFKNTELLTTEEKTIIQEQINTLTKDRRQLLGEFKLGELFCGPGGLAWGAIHADIGVPGFKILHEWSNDYDENTCKTYIRNICPDAPETVICEDVKELDISKLTPIDAFAFGFPCNDFSVVGEQKGISGNYGPLYTYGIKVLEYFKPKWFLAENVGGLRNANEGNAFSIILKAMRDAGYNLYPNLYKFETYGIPQARHRIIIVGIRNDLDLKFKIPSNKPYANCDNTCKNAIENPPIADDVPNNEKTLQKSSVVERLKYIKPGQNAFTADLPEELQLHIKGAKISQIYKRLDPNKPSYTVTGSGGGGTHIYHWDEPRALTNRERARLQTFPDDFIFIGNKESVRKQIGMAVPCLGAKIIFEAILKTFAKVPYESMEPNITE